MKKNYFNVGRLAASALLCTSVGLGTMNAQLTTQNLAYTGVIQTFTVPSCVTTITMDVRGASGGYASGGTGGLGARMIGVFNVTPGQVISYLVGKSPGSITGSYSYPGGGGGSYVALGASYASATPMIVAGGGGGGYSVPGDNAPVTTSGTGVTPGTNGNGAPSSSCGGGGGGFFTSGGADLLYSFPGASGFQQGGAGGVAAVTYTATYQPGGFGGGAAANYVGSCNLRGGAGGGYSGGSGYGTATFNVGSAGGSYNNGTSQSNTAGFQTGDGQIIFSYYPIIPITVNANPPYVCNGSTVGITASGMTTYTWSPVGSFAGSNLASITVTPSSTTSYSLTGTSSSGCAGNALITVTVTASAPSLTVASSSPSICTGNTVMLTASGALTYTWTNSGVSNGVAFSPTTTANYTVQGTNGCGTTSLVTTVTVTPLPVTAAASSTINCSGAGATLTASGATTYSWSPGASTATVFVVNPTANTVYTLTGFTGACSTVKTISLTAKPNPTLSISGNATVCIGNSTNLTVLGNAVTYTWSTLQNGLSITVSPTNTSVYSVSGTNSVNCNSSVSQVVVVNPNPVVNIAASATAVCAGGTATLSASGAANYTYTWGGGVNGATHPVNPVGAADSFSVTGTNTVTSCFTTTMITVGVFMPAITVTSNTSTCLGTGVNLAADGGDSYVWLNNSSPTQGILVTPTVNTTYTVVGQVNNQAGLSCPATAMVDVTVLALPAITASSNHTAICRGATASLTAEGAGSTGTYTWTGGLGNNPVISVAPILNQTYSVTGTDGNGCKGKASVTVGVDGCTGINTIAASSINMSVYPNPSTGEFTISSDQSVTLYIVNELGQQVKEISLNSTTPEVKVNNLSNGVYFITGRNENGSVKQKIVVAK